MESKPECLVLVTDDVAQKEARMWGKTMTLVEYSPGESLLALKLVRWQREVRRDGKENAWEIWEEKNQMAGEVTRFPDIKFARSVLDAPPL